MDQKPPSTTQRLFQEMLNRIRDGEWAVGTVIPSERTLIEEFGVSRLSIRETLSMLRALGVLDTSHGRGSVIRKIDAEILGRLFPLMLSMEGQRTFEQIFEVRIAIEVQAAGLASERRTDRDIADLRELVDRMRPQSMDAFEYSIETDLAFHLRIGRATGNPLFPMLLSALSGYVRFVQVASCKDDPARLRRAFEYHEAIANAIAEGDADRARREMEEHLLFSAGRAIDSGVLNSASDAGKTNTDVNTSADDAPAN